jgi:hypothetical protein
MNTQSPLPFPAYRHHKHFEVWCGPESKLDPLEPETEEVDIDEQSLPPKKLPGSVSIKRIEDKRA